MAVPGDSPVATSVTVNGGYYTFTELISGTYFVVITSSNFALGGVLRDYRSSDPTILESNNPADNERDVQSSFGSRTSVRARQTAGDCSTAPGDS